MEEIINAKNVDDLYEGEFEMPNDIMNEMPSVGDEDYSIRILKETALREGFINNGMYAFVSWRWVKPFAKWIGERKVLEVMAGRGWLSHALRELNVNVIATDDYSWSYECGWLPPVTDVEELDAIKSVEKYGKDIDVVVISWPYMDDTAYRIIKKLCEINPDALIVYIGESYGGCTADHHFHIHFNEIMNDECFNNASHLFQNWRGIYDTLCLGKYID